MSRFYGKINWLGCKIDSAMFGASEILLYVSYRTA